MANESETIFELIQESVKSRPIARGRNAAVYKIAAPEFSNYIIRIDNDALKRLNDTSSLTPVDYYGVGHGQGIGKIAPVLFKGDGIEIQVKQPGISLEQIFTRLVAKSKKTMSLQLAEWDAYTQVLEMIAKLPPQEYVGLLDNISWLTLLGYGVDIHAGNLMISPATLSLVDINTTTYPRTIRDADYLYNEGNELLRPAYLKMKKPKGHTPDNFEERIIAARSTIERKIKEARQTTTFPMPATWREGSKFIKRYRPQIAFKPHSTIAGIKEIPLSATPEKLRKALNEFEKIHRLAFSRG